MFARTLRHYTETQGVPLGEILQPGRPVAEVLSAVLEDAAVRYTASPQASGCLAIEGTRCNDMDARNAARNLTSAARDVIHRFVATTHPEVADVLADYTVTVMSGLSAMAREGVGRDRILRTASLATAAYRDTLSV